MPEEIDPEQLKKAQQMEEMERLKKVLMARVLSKEAYERLGRVRLVNPQAASQAEAYLLQLQQSGRLEGKVSDDKLKELLKQLTGRREKRIRKK